METVSGLKPPTDREDRNKSIYSKSIMILRSKYNTCFDKQEVVIMCNITTCKPYYAVVKH